MARPAVFLDRDGVINAYAYNAELGTVDSPANPEEFALLPGVAKAISGLNGLGLPVIVVSNQPGIAKGKFSRRILDAVTEKMTREISAGGGRIDGVYYCLHHPEAVDSALRLFCDCRKPNPGLLFRAAQERGLDLARSFMVGDGATDILAGHAAGSATIFLSSRKCYVCEELARHRARPDFLAADLMEAMEVIQMASSSRTRTTATSSDGGPCALRARDPGYAGQYLDEAGQILLRLDAAAVERMADLIVALRERGGRLFFLGVGGGAGHASHAVCDFRKIAQIEAYTPSDNVSELTARVNDDGWETCYANWLRGCRLSERDMVFVFSVGGGDAKKNISANLVRALDHAREVRATICGVVGRDGGYTAQVAHACVLVPVVNSSTVTAHTESLQAMVWHLLVSHPKLRAAEMKWESVAPAAKA
jgi:D-sedoheptulose 7-phosphate isomerase